MLSPAPLADELVSEIESLTAPFSLLAHRVASCPTFLVDALSSVGESDDYVAFLLELMAHRPDVPVRLSVTRSDYFEAADGCGLRQIELNTLAASYIGLGGRVADFHNAWAARTGASWRARENRPIDGVVEGFVAALREYGASSGCVMFVVEPNERNILDQRLLEIELSLRGVRVIRRTLEELGDCARIQNGELVVDHERVAITYFRAGLRLEELHSDAARRGWQVIAHSSTISVPDIPFLLAGTKKVQQLLTDRRILERFISVEDAARVASSFALLAALDEPITIEGSVLPAIDAARANPERFVLKPQREGGGNNLYDQELVRALSSMKRTQRNSYILMERLYPQSRPGVGLRHGVAWEGEVVSEYGHFGVFLARGEEILLNRGVGYLVRTKNMNMHEGGICSGAGYLDSLGRAGS